ncbi:hypothetical protein M5D96_005415 [Drosophila gunungcola]|uniref:Chitin-binding type-2 domain-containing protein n=1 Tax=Drosophila gunungcola TaxID=103775 RepID=A0A9P9YQA1_9MUSC|nr:hypothetical protein M5D96_005415 [Drosophila gunungcola]
MSGEIWLIIYLLCGVFEARSEGFDGSTTASVEKYGRSLILGNLSLCGNVADNVFLPFVGDCNRYYLCRSGQAIELQCESPYQFNANTQSCVNPGEADCLPTCDALSFSTFSYQRTCTKYVLCYYGQPCHDGLQYNAQTDRCDFPQNVDCVESECSIYYNAYHLRYVPSKVSCEKYFLCGIGVPREQSCTPGLHFNTKCDCCDIPSKSDCQIPIEQRKVRQLSSRLSPRTLTQNGICPSVGVHFYAHESRQDAYYYCVDGHGLVLDCSEGLRYDPKVQECREPQNVGLLDSLNSHELWFAALPALGIEHQARSAIQGDSASIQAVVVHILSRLVGYKVDALRGTLDVGVLDHGQTIHAHEVLVTLRLAGDVDDVIGVVLPDAQIVRAVHILRIVAAIGLGIVLQSIGALLDHRSAVEAEHVLGAVKWLINSGILLVVLCAHGIQAEEDLVVAPGPDDDREGGNGEDDSVYDIYKNTQIDVCNNVVDGVFLPYVGDCDKYIECKNNTILKIGSCKALDQASVPPVLCPNPNETCEVGYDPVRQICTYLKLAKCLPTCQSMELSSFCYDNTCTKYVLCYYGKPCHDGLQYNNVTDRCDFPEYVDCVANDCSVTFQPKDIIYLASKASCSKYFVCSDGQPWEQECAPGLAYNPECKCCDFAKNVNCTINATARQIVPYSRSPLRRADIECPHVGIHFYPHKSRPDAYYYCVEGRGVTLDCTPGLHYDPKVEECRQPQFVGA